MPEIQMSLQKQKKKKKIAFLKNKNKNKNNSIIFIGFACDHKRISKKKYHSIQIACISLRPKSKNM